MGNQLHFDRSCKMKAILMQNSKIMSLIKLYGLSEKTLILELNHKIDYDETHL